jgi:hypothetical protein
MADPRPILFVGDIQGCAAELAALLEAAGFRAGEHRLLPIGDTINRGPDAPGVLQLLRDNGAEPIQGNHERNLLERAAHGGPGPKAVEERSALLQLERAGMLAEALDWIATWPLFREGPDWIAVHAGLHPTLPPERTDPAFLTLVRYCDAQGNRPAEPDGQLTEAPPGYQPWDAFYQGTRTVVFGHWALRGLVWQGRLRGLDTGCVYGGSLSGCWWPAHRLVQVPSRQPRLPDRPPPPSWQVRA